MFKCLRIHIYNLNNLLVTQNLEEMSFIFKYQRMLYPEEKINIQMKKKIVENWRKNSKRYRYFCSLNNNI